MQWIDWQPKGFECSRCVHGNTREAAEVRKEIELDGNVECVKKFCYLGDMMGSGGGAKEASRARVRCVWAKFRELSPLLTARDASLKVKGKLYSLYVQCV